MVSEQPEVRFKVPMLRAILPFLIVLTALLLVRAIVNDSQGGFAIIIGSLVCYVLAYALVRVGRYDPASLVLSYGITGAAILNFGLLGYHAEHSFYLVALALLVCVALSTLFVRSKWHTLAIGFLCFGFLVVHMLVAILGGRITTLSLSLSQQIVAPVLLFTIISSLCIASRRAFHVILAEQASMHDQLADRHSALAHLVRGIAHNLNTPLGNARLALSMPGSLKEDQREVVDHSVYNSIQLIDRLREFLAQTEYSEPVVSSPWEALLFLKASVPFELAVDVEPNARRDAERPIRQHWNAVLLAGSEILDNARLFDGRSEPEITLSLRKSYAGYKLIVHNPGSHIPPEVRAKVTLPFFTTLHNRNNPGLGLYIANYIAQHILRGSLEIESSAESGTTVTLSFSELPSGRSSTLANEN